MNAERRAGKKNCEKHEAVWPPHRPGSQPELTDNKSHGNYAHGIGRHHQRVGGLIEAAKSNQWKMQMAQTMPLARYGWGMSAAIIFGSKNRANPILAKRSQ